MKTALVTGAGKRIGRAIALMLAQEGFAVAIHYNRSADDAEALASEIEQSGGSARAFGVDLLNLSEVEGLIETIAQSFAPPTCLINNASSFNFDTSDTFDKASLEEALRINMIAPTLLSRDFAKTLPEGQEGCIINILDQRIARPREGYFTYSLSKLGLAHLTELLAQSYAPRIRVCGVAPGLTLPSGAQSEEQFNDAQAHLTLNHKTTPEDVAAAVRYLILAPAVTGQVIYVDGGERYTEGIDESDIIGKPPL